LFLVLQQQSGFGDENKRGDGGKPAVPEKGQYSHPWPQTLHLHLGFCGSSFTPWAM
jgi:hypothetical protein